MEFFLILLLGFFVGIFSNLFGVGGGILIVPLLPMLAPMEPREIIATSLFTIFLVSLNNTVSFHRQRYVDWEVALKVGSFTAVGSFLAAYLTYWLSPILLKCFLGFILLFFIWQCGRRVQQVSWNLGRRAMMIFIGMSGGFTSGISGLGSGIVVSPLLLGSKIVVSEKVVPTTNAIMCFTTAFGVLALIRWPQVENPWIWGLVHGDKVFNLAFGALISGEWLRRFQHRLPERWRLAILLGVLFVLALKVFWDAYRLFRGF